MQRLRTIACAAVDNNALSGAGRCIAASGFALLLAGCTQHMAVKDVQVPTWELATAQPVTPVLVGRARISFDRPLSSTLLQPLSESFTLVVIRQERDWTTLSRRLKLPQPDEPLDFSRGAVVGILADVGESAIDGWPVHMRTVRNRNGDAWVEADFAPGIYYPVKTALYLELAYVPGLRDVRMVRIGHHTFRILPVSPMH